jgi:hypothetical protein
MAKILWSQNYEIYSYGETIGFYGVYDKMQIYAAILIKFSTIDQALLLL